MYNKKATKCTTTLSGCVVYHTLEIMKMSSSQTREHGYFLKGYSSDAYLAHVTNNKQVAKDEGRGCVEL